MKHNATIKVTQRMLDKSIIDANKSVVEFIKSHLPVDYDAIENGGKTTHTMFYSNGEDTELRMYRRPRGDKLLSIKNLTKKAKAGDTVTLSHHTGASIKNYTDGALMLCNYYIQIDVLQGETA